MKRIGRKSVDFLCIYSLLKVYIKIYSVVDQCIKETKIEGGISCETEEVQILRKYQQRNLLTILFLFIFVPDICVSY